MSVWCLCVCGCVCVFLCLIARRPLVDLVEVTRHVHAAQPRGGALLRHEEVKLRTRRHLAEKTKPRDGMTSPVYGTHTLAHTRKCTHRTSMNLQVPDLLTPREERTHTQL